MPPRPPKYDTEAIDDALYTAANANDGFIPPRTAQTIANEHGCSRSYISMRARELGLKFKRGRPRG